jgi:hypothetical protein
MPPVLGLGACGEDASTPGVAGNTGGSDAGGGSSTAGTTAATTGGSTGTGGGAIPSTGGGVGTGGFGPGNTGGAPPTVPTGGAGGGTASGELQMDLEGWVPRDGNTWGIQGAWYWYSDAAKGGQTVLDGVQDGVPPYVAGQGMCLTGTTPGGSLDGYTTWGAGVGLNLNQEAGSEETPALVSSGIQGFDITISGGGPDQVLVKFLPTNPMPACPSAGDGIEEAPSAQLSEGDNHIVIENAVTPSWACNAGDQGDPNNIAAIQIQANSGPNGGPIDICVVSVTPF